MPSTARPLRLSLRLNLFALLISVAGVAQAQEQAFVQAVAEAAAEDEAIATFYRETGYEAIWTDADDAERRQAFLTVLATAGAHGLPVARYDADSLVTAFRTATS